MSLWCEVAATWVMAIGEELSGSGREGGAGGFEGHGQGHTEIEESHTTQKGERGTAEDGGAPPELISGG